MEAFDKPALVQLADNTLVPDFDLNVADVGIITSGERLPGFGDGVGDFAPDLEDVNVIESVTPSCSRQEFSW